MYVFAVYFFSGAWFRAQINGWGMNVYTTSVDYTPPGSQYDMTCGLCGNFNSNPADDTPGFRVTSYDPLWPCMKVPSIAVRPSTGTNVAFGDIWSWTYNASDFVGGSRVPLPAVNCPYNFSRIERPIINTEDTEDITQALADHANDVAQQGGGFGFTFGGGGGNGTTNVTAVTPCVHKLPSIANTGPVRSGSSARDSFSQSPSEHLLGILFPLCSALLLKLASSVQRLRGVYAS